MIKHTHTCGICGIKTKTLKEMKIHFIRAKHKPIDMSKLIKREKK